MSRMDHDPLYVDLYGATCKIFLYSGYIYASVHQDVSMAVAHLLMLGLDVRLFLYTPED